MKTSTDKIVDAIDMIYKKGRKVEEIVVGMNIMNDVQQENWNG